MTTKVTVQANNGWPVRVALIDTNAAPGRNNEYVIVEAGEQRDFSVWDGRDLRIHEIQPGEEAK